MTPGDGPLATDPEEPPSPGPRTAGGETSPRVVAADERSETGTDADLTLLSGVLSRVLAAEGAPAGAEASLRLVDADEIARLKDRHLDGDGSSTDVLSFPVDGVESDAELIGDVVLCPSVAADQAADHAGDLSDELALLVVHAGLHLAGWDHASDDQRRAMWERERTLLGALHRDPARDPWSEDPVKGTHQ